jgi:hypothetical protein
MLANKPSSMTNEKVEELNRLGFTWAMRESHTAWEERFEVSVDILVCAFPLTKSHAHII